MEGGRYCMWLLESAVYGIISGVTEFLPVSSRAHQALLQYLFGGGMESSLSNLLVHIGVLASILVACREYIGRLYREQQTSAVSRRRRNRTMDSKSYYDLRLLKTAVLPLLAGLLLYGVTAKFAGNLLALMGFLILNAVILLVADHTRRGNRDSRTMSGLDGIVMGIAGAVSVLPGVSRTGMITAYTSVRGADSQNAVNWAVLLGIPASFYAICYDIFLLFAGGVGAFSFPVIAGAIIAGSAAFCGGYAGIAVLKLMLPNSGFSKFAYYSIGIAMFSFILYLIT